MALQQGINEMQGTIGNLTYYKSKHGFLVRRKSSLTKAQVLSNPKMLATRQNMAEFKSAGHSAKVFRSAIRPLLTVAKDSGLHSRFLKIMKEIVKTDSTNLRGSRNVTKGSLTLLKSFNFNADSKLDTIFYAPYTTTINRVAGSLKLDIPAFQPNVMLPAPQGATHFKIFSSSCEIDFLKEISIVDNQQTAPLPCDNNLTAAISHLHNATANSTLPLFLLMFSFTRQ